MLKIKFNWFQNFKLCLKIKIYIEKFMCLTYDNINIYVLKETYWDCR